MALDTVTAAADTFKDGIVASDLGIESAINAQLVSLLENNITSVDIVARDKQRRNGKELAILIGYQDSGDVVLTDPYKLVTFIGSTLAEVNTAAAAFRTANPGYYHANPMIKFFNEFSSANKPYVVFQFYCEDANGGSNWRPDNWDGGCTIGGLISATQVAYGVGANNIGGSNNMTYNPTLATGGLSVNNTTPSVNPTTGAVRIAGGLGVNSTTYIGGNLILPYAFNREIRLGNVNGDVARLKVHFNGGRLNLGSDTAGRQFWFTTKDGRLFSRTTEGDGGVEIFTLSNTGAGILDNTFIHGWKVALGSSTDSEDWNAILARTDPGAYAAAADTDGLDTYLRLQSGGADAGADPDGGSLRIYPGAAGAGGAGVQGGVYIYTDTAAGILLGDRGTPGWATFSNFSGSAGDASLSISASGNSYLQCKSGSQVQIRDAAVPMVIIDSTNGIQLQNNYPLLLQGLFRSPPTRETANNTLTRKNQLFVLQINSGITTSVWAAPSDGDTIFVRNYSAGNNTLSGNGNTIEGAATMTLLSGESVWLVWSNTDSDWIVF